MTQIILRAYLSNALIILTLFLYSLPLVASESPTLVWLKPIESDQKMEGNTIVGGSALELMQFVAEQIKGVDHKFEAYPIKRSWHLIQRSSLENTAYCFWGASYKKEREQWGVFTQPTSVDLPYMVAARSGELSKYVKGDSISVEALIKAGHTTVIFDKVINAWTKIIEEVGDFKGVTISGLDRDLSEHTLLLLENRRIDFGYISHRSIEDLDIANNSNIELYEIRELADVDVGDARLLCSKTPLGNEMVSSINQALDKIHSNEQLTAEFQDLIFKAEGYPDNLKEVYRRQWKKVFH